MHINLSRPRRSVLLKHRLRTPYLLAPETRSRLRGHRWLATLALTGWIVASTGLPAHAEPKTEQTLEGGIQIWFGENWGLVRADIGPRYTRGAFSIRPHGAVGPSFLPGVAGTPTSLGAYVDLDAAIPLGDRKSLQVGPGAGVTTVIGIHSAIGSHVIPQGILQAAYRWEGNLIGLQLLGGPRYDWDINTGAESIWFSGVGLRFEYVVR